MLSSWDPSGVRDAIDSIVPHAFGEYDKCGSWCKFLKDPVAKYSSLPNGVGLHGESLRAELTKVFLVSAQNAKKLAPCGNTLPNESFNNSVASKAPKARHYSGSESLVYRVKTLDSHMTNNVSEFNKENCLSPQGLEGES